VKVIADFVGSTSSMIIYFKGFLYPNNKSYLG